LDSGRLGKALLAQKILAVSRELSKKSALATNCPSDDCIDVVDSLLALDREPSSHRRTHHEGKKYDTADFPRDHFFLCGIFTHDEE
jgi:hypothetical protein